MVATPATCYLRRANFWSGAGGFYGKFTVDERSQLMKFHSCNEAFIQGKAFSQEYPRTRGDYKLREIWRNWKECEEEVKRIVRVVIYPSAKSAKDELRHCTNEDKHSWLRDLPTWYAFDLSAYVIPSFAALSGDGMSQAEIDRHQPYLESLCRSSLGTLNQAHRALQAPIHEEYKRMKSGQSVIGYALTSVRQDFEQIIDLTPPDIKRCIYPSIQEVQCVI
jgi:hypothetical protein